MSYIAYIGVARKSVTDASNDHMDGIWIQLTAISDVICQTSRLAADLLRVYIVRVWHDRVWDARRNQCRAGNEYLQFPLQRISWQTASDVKFDSTRDASWIPRSCRARSVRTKSRSFLLTASCLCFRALHFTSSCVRFLFWSYYWTWFVFWQSTVVSVNENSYT